MFGYLTILTGTLSITKLPSGEVGRIALYIWAIVTGRRPSTLFCEGKRVSRVSCGFHVKAEYIYLAFSINGDIAGHAVSGVGWFFRFDHDCNRNKGPDPCGTHFHFLKGPDPYGTHFHFVHPM